MRRIVLAISCAAIGIVGAEVVSPAARAATVCVGPGAGCFGQIQPAVDAAHDGDTITLARGTFAGGVTIDVSVALVGAGAGATVIQGGGPVLTIGTFFGTRRPNVSIKGVTITGGLNDSKPDPPVTFGGGVWIPVSDGNLTGATVTISDSLITRNRVAPRELIPPGFCQIACAFASGGGIDNGGALTITNSRISDNESGSTASSASVATKAGAGGIMNRNQGTLTLRHSFVTGNRATATAPSGQEVDAGGIHSDGPLTIEDSVVSGNSAQLTSSYPAEVEQVALGGGITASECCGVSATATITRSIVSGNRVVAGNASGDLVAFAGGIVGFTSSLAVTDSTVDHNEVDARLASSSTAGAFADGGGLEIDGAATIRNALVAGNRVTVSAPAGMAVAQGGGIANAGQLAVQRTLVIGNSASARGAGGAAQGGGIWNDTFGEGAPPSLVMSDSAVVGNSLDGAPAVALQGGGLFTAFPVTLTRTLIAGNRPDQCSGC